MAIVGSNYAAEKILKPLGINIKNAISATIYFRKDDIVTAQVTYLVDIPDKWDQIELKNFRLVEIKDETNQNI